jgi:hypothetical protein
MVRMLSYGLRLAITGNFRLGAIILTALTALGRNLSEPPRKRKLQMARWLS